MSIVQTPIGTIEPIAKPPLPTVSSLVTATATATSIPTPLPSPSSQWKQKFSAPKTLLIGPPGSGKTTSLVTYIEAGLELFVIITDPGGEEALLDAMEARKLPIDKLHWKYIPCASPGWDTLEKMATTITNLGYDDITKIKSGVEKRDFQQFLALLKCLANFQCDRTGEFFGPVDSWGPNRALGLDSLSGVNTMAMDMVLGAKPAAHQGEWGVAMNAEEKLIKKLCADLRCFFTLIAHIEREVDEVAGIPKVMVSALGKKLAPKLPKDFSDVVTSYREGTSFYWSTTMVNFDLKARTLPLKDKLSPNFGQIVDGWRKRTHLASTQKP